MVSRINQNIWALVGFTVILLFQCIVPSQFNGFESPIQKGFQVLIDNNYAHELFSKRSSEVSFHHRIIFRSVHRFLINVGLPIQLAFTFLSCLLIIANYFVLLRISLLLLPNKKTLPILAIGYFGLFTILFGYLGGMFTYEEPVQYFFILFTLYCLINGRVWLAAACFFLSLLSKETSLLFLPIWVYLKWDHRWISKNNILLAAVVLLYLLYHTFWISSGMGKELIEYSVEKRFFAWEKNFASLRATSETLFDAFFVLGIPLLLGLKFKSTIQKFFNQRVFHSFLFLCLVNTLIVLIAAKASEARLFALPLLLFIPLFPAFVPKATFHKQMTRDILIALAIAVPIILLLYTPGMVGTGYIYKCYGILYLACFIYIFRSKNNLTGIFTSENKKYI